MYEEPASVGARGCPRILVIRRDNIGDLVCTTPLLEALRVARPNAWIAVLANTYNSEVLSRNPSVDAVYTYEKLKHRSSPFLRLVLDRLRLTSELRRKALDCVLVPAPAPQTLKLAGSIKARSIVSADPMDQRHEVERTHALGASLGVIGTPGPMRIYPDPALVSVLRERIRPGPLVAVHLSARRPAQKWPVERYATFVREVSRRARVMLLWSPGAAFDAQHPGDDSAAEHLRQMLGGQSVDAVPTPDLATLVAALSLSRFVVCPDGGAMHIAAALGKPIVALFGDSVVHRWRPWSVDHRVVRPTSGDLRDLQVESVLAALDELAEH